MWVDPGRPPERLRGRPLRAPPRYDYGLIAALEALITESETGWRQLYGGTG